MMAIRLASLVFVLLLSSGLASAQSYTSYGARGCGSLVKAVDTTNPANKYEKDFVELSTKSWIGGYITAYNSWNVAVSKNPNILSSSDIDGAYMSMLIYCRANPLKDLSDAIADTINQLSPKKKR
jgi:hypothetical protein